MTTGSGSLAILPIITIDGPTASGKGTTAERVAQTLGLHFLDSGALYRLTAFAALKQGIDLADTAHHVTQLSTIARELSIHFKGAQIFLDDQEVSRHLREERIGKGASQIAALPAVRHALFARQRAFCAPPGLVADGRDMGTVVFPEAQLKIFLTASAEARAQRRYKQLIEKGVSANLHALLQDLRERDARDISRSVAPLVAAPDAIMIDNSHLDVDEVVQQIVDLAAQRFIPS